MNFLNFFTLIVSLFFLLELMCLWPLYSSRANVSRRADISSRMWTLSFCMFFHIIQKTSLYRVLWYSTGWLVPNRDDSLVTTCPKISCFQAESSNIRVFKTTWPCVCSMRVLDFGKILWEKKILNLKKIDAVASRTGLGPHKHSQSP